MKMPQTYGAEGERVLPPVSPGEERSRELRAFLFLAVILAPLLAVLFVGGYGFAVWVYQIFAGPPGPPPFQS